MKRLIVGLLIVGCSSITTLPQTSARPDANSPEFRLRIISNKQNYALHEKFSTRTEFTNLTQHTLCFPEPPQDCGSCRRGSLETSAIAVGSESREMFMCHVYDRGISREEFVREIQQRWVRLAPNAVYTTKTAQAGFDLDVAGEWQIKANYVPPDSRYGETRQDDWNLQSAVQSFGCTVPTLRTSSEPVTINVTSPR